MNTSVPGAAEPVFEVFAIRFARRERSNRGEHFYRHVDDCAAGFPIDYFTWLAVPVGGGPAVAFDAGFTAATAERRGDRRYLASPVDTMAALGVGVEDVA